ncbi:hypothetical protein MNB_SM-3-254 [hydrothermal vent metagenome]|uniref:Inner spore coat protein H n=1 Tax=hydrothermal vent metagenome TaxID=652676 RepID=A0A1W1D439_9ZZZZ
MYQKILFYFFLTFFISGCGSYNNIKHLPSVVGDISDDSSLYNEIVTLKKVYVTLPVPNKAKCTPWDDQTGPERPCTFDDINHDLYANDNYRPYLEAIVDSDTFHTNIENAKFKMRGNYTRLAPQKGYGIKFFSKTDLPFGTRKLNLNKHWADRSRMKNKLAMDLMRDIPNITSLRTQFYNLFIDSQDYGLFTHVEALSQEYITDRGWNKNDNLYNANIFSFNEDPFLAVDPKSCQPVYPNEFNLRVEIKNGTNHCKFQEMLHAVNSNMPIDQVIEKYFNRKNYLTWLAIEIILGNKDTFYHNFALYNPINSDTFYFVPWDYDGAWSEKQYLGKFEYSIGVWWPDPLHRKFLSIKKNREDLDAMVYKIRNQYITDIKMKNLIDKYMPIVSEFVSKEPDSQYDNLNYMKESANNLISLIQDNNLKLYEDEKGVPMPFDVSYDGETHTLHWTESVDFEKDPIVYDLTISKDLNMSNPILVRKNMSSLQYNLGSDTFSAGTYYAQVIAKERDHPSYYQLAYIPAKKDADGNNYWGILEFEYK